jgi:NosR/NirI family nitrous oxide reductase transcriptional regulator
MRKDAARSVTDQRFAAVALLAGALLAYFASPLSALADQFGDPNLDKNLMERLTPAALQQAFPGAEEVEWIDGSPPVIAVKIDGEIAGYLFSTRESVNATGYAGVAFDLVAGMTIDGDMTGAVLLYHREAIIGRGVPQSILDTFIASIADASLNDFKPIRPDIMSRASTSGRLMKRGLQSSAKLVFAGHVIGVEPVTEPALDRDGFALLSFDEMIAGGSILDFPLTMGEVLDRFREAGGRGALPDGNFLTGGNREEIFTEMYAGLFTPRSIGANLFSGAQYEGYQQNEGEGELTLWVASDGPFSFVSNSHFQAANDYLFDRVKLVQGDLEIRLTKDFHRRLWHGPEPGRSRGTTVLFRLPADAGLDPLAPFDVVLMIAGKDSDGSPMTIEVPMAYQLPERHMLLPPPPPVPIWVEAWREKQVDIAILGLLLVFVTIVFLFQGVLTRSRRAFTLVRVGTLAFVLGWLGWYAGAQLSIINVLAYIQAPFGGTGLSAFVLDPLIFILSVYVAVTLFVLGRGVFCGWLCPFGAAQELLNRLARLLRIPQINVSETLQQRLWAVKYLVAIFLIGAVFVSVDAAERYAEIEPFRTAITVHFNRDWQFVLYAAGLLGVGLFFERAYCRFLCPLGGSLAVLGRFHMFNWLRRRQACGTSCRICEQECPVGAIGRDGQINLNECFQCMDCQVAFYDDHKCPPLIERRTRKKARKAATAAVTGAAPGAIPGAVLAE